MPLCVINAVFVAQKRHNVFQLARVILHFEIARNCQDGNFGIVKLSPFSGIIGCVYVFRSESVENFNIS